MNKNIVAFFMLICMLNTLSFNVFAVNHFGTADALKNTPCPVCGYTTGEKLSIIVLGESLKRYNILFNCPNCDTELLMVADSNFGGNYNNVQVKSGDIRTKKDVLDELENEGVNNKTLPPETNTVPIQTESQLYFEKDGSPETETTESVTLPIIISDVLRADTSAYLSETNKAFEIEESHITTHDAPFIGYDIIIESTEMSTNITDNTTQAMSFDSNSVGHSDTTNPAIYKDANPKTGITPIYGILAVTAGIFIVILRKPNAK
ncbi:MAG: hypothetical protein FWF94_04170 [Oscillospiraceae bacterium]|nr:hypothetical protein [Oscillospiraceae bacterium]